MCVIEDGYRLTREIKRNKILKPMPVVILTSRLHPGGKGDSSGIRYRVATAAASALAARYLARKDAAILTMIGAGAMSPFLIRAHCAARPIERVLLWNHNPGRAHDLAAKLKAEGLPVEAVDNREAAIRQADIVSAAAFSPAEDLLATGSFRTIKLWKRAAVEKMADLPNTTGATLLATAPSGKFVVLGLADGRLAITDTTVADPAAVLRVFGVVGQPVTAGALTSDGTIMYAAGKDNIVTAWRLADGVAIGRLIRPAEVRSIGIANGGTQLVTAEADNAVRVWQLPLGEPTGDSAATKPISRR